MLPTNSPLSQVTPGVTTEPLRSPAATDSQEQYGGMIDGHIPLSDIGEVVLGNVTDQPNTNGNPTLLPLPPLGDEFEDSLYIFGFCIVGLLALTVYCVLK